MTEKAAYIILRLEGFRCDDEPTKFPALPCRVESSGIIYFFSSWTEALKYKTIHGY